MKFFLLSSLVFFFLSKVWAQNPTCFSQADTFFVAPQAEVHVFGSVVINGSSTHLIHHGFLQTYNSVQTGNFELQNQGNVLSDGDFKIEQDWVNNGKLQIDSGMVEMYGPNQWFSGDSISRFYDLLLSGTDKKEQAQDIRIRNKLNLTDKELAVHQQRLYLDHPSPNNLLFNTTFGSEGIISTDEDGQIHKVILQNQSNRIPTGSRQTQFRHRPLVATLNNLASDTLQITYHQHSPDLLAAPSLDLDSLCRIQTNYFYTLNAASSSSHYDFGFTAHLPTDGNFPDPSYWANPTWKPISGTYSVSETDYVRYHAPDEHDFTQEHYTLGHRTPPAPAILADTTECYALSHAAVEIPPAMPLYEWSVTNTDLSAEIQTGQGTNQITINWNNYIGGEIGVRYQDPDNCWSFPSSINVQDVSVLAGFSSNHTNSNNFDTHFTFNNQSSANADEFSWILPDEQFSMFTSDPLNYTFSTNGEEVQYDIMLIATDHEFGCIDTAIHSITVPNIFVVYAPNSFTPNGDGINDFFFIDASSILALDLRIYNRWGEQIYGGSTGSDSKEASWDGKYHGVPVPTGTYTFIAAITPKNYNNAEAAKVEYTGHIVVLY